MRKCSTSTEKNKDGKNHTGVKYKHGFYKSSNSHQIKKDSISV